MLKCLLDETMFSKKRVASRVRAEEERHNSIHYTGAHLGFLLGNWVVVTCLLFHLLPDPG